MPTKVVLLVVGSAFLHALWNALLKRTRDPEVAVLAVVVVSGVTSIALHLALGARLPTAAGAAWCAAAGVLEAGYFVTLARALTRAPLGPVYTVVRGGGLLVLWPLAITVLGERLTPAIAGGTVLVLAGLVATGAASGLRGALSPGRLGWAAVSALFVGSYGITYKLALSAGTSPSLVNASLVVASVVNVVAASADKRRAAIRAVRDEPWKIVVSGVLGASGFLVVLVAMQDAGAGVVLTLRNTSILFAQLFGAIAGERPRLAALAGAVLVTAGAILLARG